MRIGGSALPSMSLVEAPYKDMLGFAAATVVVDVAIAVESAVTA